MMEHSTGGDWDLRGRDLTGLFASAVLSDTCTDAANRAGRRFSRYFPGWKLYCAIVRGDDRFNRTLEAWAITCARMLARARKRNGRSFISRSVRMKPDWIKCAALDALEHVRTGHFPMGVNLRGAQFNVADKTYQSIRDPVAACMWAGLREFEAKLHSDYFDVRREEKSITLKTGGITIMEEKSKPKRLRYVSAAITYIHGEGCARTIPAMST